MLACKKEPRYAELPVQLTDSLVQIGTSGVFVSAVKEIGPKPSTNSVVLPLAKNCATTDTLWISVTYPITVCFPTDFPTENAITMFKNAKEPDALASIIASKAPVTHKVSRRIGAYDGLLCKTRGGPWTAEITDQEPCTDEANPPHFYSLVTLGVQQHLSWQWWGRLDDHPTAVAFIGEPWLRNSGNVDCDQSDLTNCGGATSPPGITPPVILAQPDEIRNR